LHAHMDPLLRFAAGWARGVLRERHTGKGTTGQQGGSKGESVEPPKIGHSASPYRPSTEPPPQKFQTQALNSWAARESAAPKPPASCQNRPALLIIFFARPWRLLNTWCPMTKVVVRCFGLTLDGYGAGPDQSLENPLGVGGGAAFSWFFGTRTFQRM